MAHDANWYRGMIAVGFIFSAGFVCGYQFKTWRAEWLKRRRERLRVKLAETQRELDNMKA